MEIIPIPFNMLEPPRQEVFIFASLAPWTVPGIKEALMYSTADEYRNVFVL